MKNITIDKQTVMRVWQSGRSWLGRLPVFLFLTRYRLIGTLILLVCVVLSGAVAAILLLTEPRPLAETVVPTRQISLDVDTIDALEFWIEARRFQFEQGLSLPRPDIFTP